MPMELAPTELRPIVASCMAVLERLASEKSLKIAVEIPDGLPKLNADGKRLSQVVLNLLDNSVKYTPEGGSITVRAVAAKDFVQVDISDTGIGIPKDDLGRVFERFYRVDKARSRELGGTGLGLSIVRHIVQAHGGEVRVESTLGKGSTFSFAIPQAAQG
jgi:two-component system phosphate regulon sensor histidine kinase PhoR